jgi:hypothetical protein
LKRLTDIEYEPHEDEIRISSRFLSWIDIFR